MKMFFKTFSYSKSRVTKAVERAKKIELSIRNMNQKNSLKQIKLV